MSNHKKNSRLLLNIALVIAIALLILLVVFEPGLEKESNTSSLLSLDKDQITSIRIIHNEETIQLEKQNDKWVITIPVRAEGNEFKINSLLNLVKTKSHAHYSPQEIDLAPIRLDKPRSRVFFNETEIAFGDTQPINHQRYVMTGGIVHLINDNYYHHTITTAGNYVSFSLLPPESNIRKIIFPDKSVLEKTDGKWNTKIDISADNITSLVNDWLYAEAIEVKLYKAEKPDKKVTLYIQGQERPVIFYIFRKEDDVWLINESLTLKYMLTEEIANKLLDPDSYKKNVSGK
ncbi:MAG: DUF4340 domain-containing protein [Gammaproteobacteria bacterium]|nr:DUF4340 domain-containing protein [Gammaproteobacteria bacterium]MDH5593074.1 DUF4340 domain-containing protein [Gammaproteobacteria bacterium]